MLHTITLPTTKAEIWLETALSCKLRAFSTISNFDPKKKEVVFVMGANEDIKVAWELFVERFNRIAGLDKSSQN